MKNSIWLGCVGGIIVMACGLTAWGAGDKAAGGAEAKATAPGGDCLLFTSFRQNGQDGLHLAFSTDGYAWKELNNDKPLLKPGIGRDKLMRDPCVVQGADGVFHMVWTTGWGDRIIGYASTRDFIEWSAQKEIPAMMHEPKARNAWAPELFFDERKGEFLIFWASTIPGQFAETEAAADKGWNHRMYFTATKDFVAFEPTKLFYDGGFNVIDATILKAGQKYNLIVKDETLKPARKHLRIATADDPRGPWSKASEPFTISWVEGPSAIRIGSEYFVYFDHYAAPHYYGAVKSADLKSWEDVSKKMTFPKDHRHGTVIRVSKEVLARLQAMK